MSREDDLGALWLKSGSSGKFMAGHVEIDGRKHPIVVFKNGYKREDRHPDYVIKKGRQRGEQRQEAEDEDVPF